MFLGSIGRLPRPPRLPSGRLRWPTALVPSWVPAAGAVAVYESGGSVLTNTWRSTHITEDEFYSSKMRNAYSGTFLMRQWRTHGGLVLIGGGHANTNYNGVHVVTLGPTSIYFERLVDPTNWSAGDTGDIESEWNAYAEVTGSDPLQIPQGHSYGMRAVVGNRVEVVIRQAFKYTGGGDEESQSYHSLDLSNPATASSARAWVRESDSTGAWSGTSPPGFTTYVPAQDRIYYMCRSSTNLRWFDRATESWVVGDNAGWGYPSADTDGGDPVTGVLFDVPERNLLVAGYRQSGNLVLQYIDTTQSQPSVATATLGSSLALPVEGGKAVCWCSRSQRILVFGVTSNADRVYEITIPSPPSGTWTVDSHAISGGSIDPVSIMTRSGWGASYNDLTRTVNFVHDLKNASSSPDTIDRVTVYRPRNT